MRAVIVLLLLAIVTTACTGQVVTTSTTPAGGTQRLAYGTDASQWVDVTLPGRPDGGPYPTVAFLHGGFWYAGYDADLMDDLVTDALGRGYATANVEYRRVNGGGGFPETFEDVAAALDLLSDVDGVDPGRVVVVGHSAGGHLALWAGNRSQLPAGAPGADPGLTPCGIVGQAPVADLTTAAQDNLGGGAAQALMGGGPSALPDAYALADPVRLVGNDVPVLLVHGTRDRLVPDSQSDAYASAAAMIGRGAVTRLPYDGGHFDVLDPRKAVWADTVAWISTTCGFEPTP